MEIIQNAIPHLQALWLPLKGYGWLLGIIFIVSGGYKVGNSRQTRGYNGASSHVGTTAIIAGFFLTSLTSAMDTFSWTAFKHDAPAVLSYAPPNPGSVEGLLVQFGVYVINLVGLWGFIKGWSILANRTNSSYSFGQGMTHILGGTLAMNFISFAQMMGSSLGSGFNSIILKFIG